MIEQAPREALSRKILETLKDKPTFEIADDANSVSGWRLEGDPHYTCIPPADRTVDPGIVRQIQVVDPALVPIWRRQLYLRPLSNTPVLYTHVGLARHVRNSKRALQLHGVTLPADWVGPAPNELVLMWEFLGDRMMRQGGPAGWMDFDGQLLKQIQKDWVSDTTNVAEALERSARKRRDHRRRALLAVAAEKAYRVKQLESLDRKLSEATPEEFRRYQAKVNGLDRKPRVFMEH